MKKLLFLFAGLLIGAVTAFGAVASYSSFTDISPEDWYSSSIIRMANNGIIEGYSDKTFRPNQDITRAETTVMMDRMLKLMEERGLKDYYISEKFSIKFVKNLIQEGEEIGESIDGVGIIGHDDRIKIFSKDEAQGIESAILELIKSKGKNPANCTVQQVDETIGNYNGRYIIELADKNINYTEAELKRISDADAEAKSDGGPFNGDWMKTEIYRERLMSLCSDYADPASKGTSKSIGSYFEYNNYLAKDKFIFLEESYDPEFYEWGSIEFIKK
jgi:hypothetical protein